MNSKVKNRKKIIVLIAMMMVCGHSFAQGWRERPEEIDTKISNLHYNSTTHCVEFTLKFKAGAYYIPNDNNGGRWSSLNLYWDVYPNAGVLLGPGQTATYYPNHDITTCEFQQMNHNGTPMPPSIPYRSNMFRTAGGPHDLTYQYEPIAHYSIPVASGTPNSDFHIVQRNRYDGWSIITSCMWTSNLHVAYPNLASDAAWFRSIPGGTYYLEEGCPAQALWTGTVDNDWFDSDNWVDPSVAAYPLPALGSIPCASTKVYIPGSLYRGNDLDQVNPITHFPIFLEDQEPTCDEITFFQGGQLGGLELESLDYNKARVQLNFDRENSWIIAQPHNYDPDYFYNFSKGYSTQELSSSQWHMLSMPLSGIVSGDFAYGGFPMTFMRKFNIYNDEDFSTGDWSASYTSTDEPLVPGEGFAFYIYPSGGTFGSQYSGNGTTGTSSTSSFYGGNYGLSQTASVMEFPTYDNTKKLQSHRIQSYNSGLSTFYEVATNEGHRGEIIGVSGTKTRSNADYQLNLGDYTVSVEVAAVPKEVLLGNPYIATLSFSQFYADNFGSNTGQGPYLEKAYRVWNGTSFSDYDGNTGQSTTGDLTDYIPPMQGFFIKSRRSTFRNFRFSSSQTVANPSPATNPVLRSASGEENIIRLSARNSYATTSALIAQLPNASVEYRDSEDITKLFSPTQNVAQNGNFSKVPEVYTLADRTALSMNYINNVSATIPIGIRTAASNVVATTTLKLTGMNHYAADKIEFVDKGENGTEENITDITHRQDFEHTFLNGAGGYQSGRFFLRISPKTTTGLEETVADGAIQVYKSLNAIHVVSSPNDPIKQIRIYDLQGRILYNNTSVGTDIYLVKDRFAAQQVLVVQVATEKKTSSVKLKN